MMVVVVTFSGCIDHQVAR